MPPSLYNLVSSPSVDTCFTERVFNSLLARVKPDLILDVGSRDGTDALHFKRMFPTAEVVAYEANPALYAKMRADASLARAGVRVEGVAVADFDGQSSFQIFNQTKGTGSLLARRGKQNMDQHHVKVRRLDSLHADSRNKAIALWIDAEGNSFEVIKGCGRLLDKVVLIHAEVESVPLFEGQRLRPEFTSLMKESGFVHVDGGILKNKVAGNEIFLRSALARRPSMLLHVTGLKIYLQARHALEHLRLIGIARTALKPFRWVMGKRTRT